MLEIDDTQFKARVISSSYAAPVESNTLIAIILYNITVKKIWSKSLEKLNKICDHDDKNKIYDKQ